MSQTYATYADCAELHTPSGIVRLFAVRAGSSSQKLALLPLEGGFTGGFHGSRGTLVQAAFENPLLKCKCFPSLKPT